MVSVPRYFAGHSARRGDRYAARGMCGRIALIEPPERLARLVGAVAEWTGTDPGVPWWNVPPSTAVPLLVADRLSPPPAGGHRPRRLRTAQWGLPAPWDGSRAGGSRLFNARAETLASRPVFRQAARCRRGIVPVAGFYEWSTAAVDKVRGARRQPWLFERADGQPLGLAALFEDRRDGHARADTSAPLRCTVITTAANDDVVAVHGRMPVVLEPEQWDRWLDPDEQRVDAVEDLLRPSPPGTLRADHCDPRRPR